MAIVDDNRETVGLFHTARIVAAKAGVASLGFGFLLTGVALTPTMWLMPLGLPWTLLGVALLATAEAPVQRS